MLLLLLGAIFLLGCVQPPAQAPAATPAATSVISAKVATPTPTALPTNLSNEMQTMADALKAVNIVNGEFLETFSEINDAKEAANAYASHLDGLDPEANGTVFLRGNIDAARHFLASNEYYLGAMNTGKRVTQNFSCKDRKAYELAMNLTSSSIAEGRKGTDILYSLAGKYPAIAVQSGTQLAADLIGAFYDGMEESVNETLAIINDKCG